MKLVGTEKYILYNPSYLWNLKNLNSERKAEERRLLGQEVGEGQTLWELT